MKKKKKKEKKKYWWIPTVLLTALALILLSYEVVVIAAKGRCYDDVTDIPYNKVTLVLGTSPKVIGGKTNRFFTNRMEAAADLYKAGKTSFIVVSGDNRFKSYNEPREMRRALVGFGVPEDRIYQDYAGFSTLDSVVRMKTIFGQNRFTVVSQRFHNERALYLAKANGIEAIALNAKDPTPYYSFKTRMREYLARVKMFIDLAIGKQPYFGGESIEITAADSK